MKHHTASFISILFLLASICVKGQDQAICPGGWTLYSPGNKCFKVVNSTGPHKRNQGGFWAGCKRTGLDLPWPWKTGDGKLASICSKDEQEFVMNAVIRPDDGTSFWLGLFRDAKGRWRWVDGSDKASPRCTYNHWDAGQPDNAGNRQRCVIMQSVDGKAGVWDDVDCATSSIPAAICQIPAKRSGMSSVRTTLSFKRPPGTEGLECSRIISGEGAAQSRIVHSDKDDMNLPMDCASIRMRNYFPKKPMSKEEAQFPVAFARIVYTDYRFLEMEFAAAYAPQNAFCFAIDAKASQEFHERIHALASCFPNVIVAKNEYRLESSGRNLWFAYMECFRQLVNHRQRWEYVVTLQNHDVMIKTTQELVQILKWLNGANDVEVYPVPLDRGVDFNANWSFAGLNLFKNVSRNNGNQSLTLAYGLDESAVSRAAVEFIVNELNVTKFLQQVNTDHGADELVLPTLDATDTVGLPGGFTLECIRRNMKAPGVARYTLWVDPANCGSGVIRHNLCVFGTQDLHRLVDLPHLSVNKMMPEVDFGASVCLHELMFNRTYLNRTLSHLNHDLYASLPQVRYQTERKKPHFNLSDFDCDSHESSAFSHW